MDLLIKDMILLGGGGGGPRGVDKTPKLFLRGRIFCISSRHH